MKEQRETSQDAIKHSFFNDYIKSLLDQIKKIVGRNLLDQIERLKNEVSFVRGELKDKNAFAKTHFNSGSDDKNQQNVYGNQTRRLCVTANESNTLRKKDKTNYNNTDNNRDSNNKNKNNSSTQNTVFSTQNEENNNDNGKEHDSDLENSNIIENKEVAGITMILEK